MGQVSCSCRWICRIIDGIAELVSPPTKRKHRVERVWWAQPCLQRVCDGHEYQDEEEELFHVCELLVTSVDHNTSQSGTPPDKDEWLASMGEEVYEEWTPVYLRHNSIIF